MEWDEYLQSWNYDKFSSKQRWSFNLGIWSKICKIRCLGREIFNRKLPAAYIDFFSCYGQYAKNGHYLL